MKNLGQILGEDFFFLENTMILGKVKNPSLISCENLMFFSEQHDFGTKIGRCLRNPHNFLPNPTHKILHVLLINYL